MHETSIKIASRHNRATHRIVWNEIPSSIHKLVEKWHNIQNVAFICDNTHTELGWVHWYFFPSIWETFWRMCKKKKEQKFITIAIEIFFKRTKTCHFWSHSETTATSKKKNILWGKGQRLIMRNKKHIQKFIININAIFFYLCH